MISKVGSLQSSQAASQARQVEAQPAPQQRAAKAEAEATAPRAAVVVQIGSQARALATQYEAAPQTRVADPSAQRATAAQSVARPRLGDSSEARAELEIEPVVSQPVPDFSAAAKEVGATPARSVYSSSAGADTSSASQASRSGRQFVA